jgi:hypothetical protein
MVGNQIANLILGLSFAHNTGCKCPNGSYEAIWTSKLQDLSNGVKNSSMQCVLTFAIKL